MFLAVYNIWSAFQVDWINILDIYTLRVNCQTTSIVWLNFWDTSNPLGVSGIIRGNNLDCETTTDNFSPLLFFRGTTSTSTWFQP